MNHKPKSICAGLTPFSAAYSIGSVQCADSATYSVAFTNEYWKAASEGTPITVTDQFFNELPQVTVSVTGVPIPDPHSPPTLTATACFTGASAQWYQTDDTGGQYSKKPIPGATGMGYTFPDPVTCESLGPSGYFLVEVFDGDWFPRVSAPIHVYGACQ